MAIEIIWTDCYICGKKCSLGKIHYDCAIIRLLGLLERLNKNLEKEVN